MQGGYETFEHGADIGIRGWGQTLEEAFINAAKALFSLMVSNLEEVTPEREEKIEAQGEDLEELFLDWLNKLLAVAGMYNLVFATFSCQILQGYRLKGLARGERIDPNKHELGAEVKGATYTMLKVAQQDGLWVAQCVVDV